MEAKRWPFSLHKNSAEYSNCQHQVALVGAAADCTIAALDAMLTVHPTGDVTAAETSLEAHIVATQTGAARGLDRIDQLGLLLNSQCTYDDAGPPAHTPRASGPFSRRSRAH